MERQINLFEAPIESGKIVSKYNTKIKAHIYEPTHEKPYIQELLDNKKAFRLIRKIKNSNVDIKEKRFLIDAASRHIIFNFNRIADYYAHSSAEMQELMEESALVIIDFDKAVDNGYVKLSDSIIDQYMEEVENE